MELICPMCGFPLREEQTALRCEKGHSYDIARQGYVNLLLVQNKRSLQPGDTRQQVISRRQFLEGGFYAPIRDAVCRMALEQHCTGPILDAGCGEGYYSTHLAKVLDSRLIGVDISKEAVRCAAGKYKDALWLCASAARLPVADKSVGLLTSLFAMTAPEEFRRVLLPEGGFLQVLAAPDHLLELKKIIYPELKEKPKDSMPTLPGFRLVCSRPVSFSFTVEGEQVQQLLSMTPHVYRISEQGAHRLAQTRTLTDRASCVVNFYRPL